MIMKWSELKIIPAEISDHEELTEITKKSKAHWGFSNEVLLEWAPLLTVTAEYIEKNTVLKIVQNNRILGYYSYYFIDENTLKLDNMFILPEFIGKGIGNALIHDFLEKASASAVQKIVLDAEPKAEGFYQKFGFETIGHLASSINDRFLPIMELRLPQ